MTTNITGSFNVSMSYDTTRSTSNSTDYEMNNTRTRTSLTPHCSVLLLHAATQVTYNRSLDAVDTCHSAVCAAIPSDLPTL